MLMDRSPWVHELEHDARSTNPVVILCLHRAYQLTSLRTSTCYPPCRFGGRVEADSGNWVGLCFFSAFSIFL
jgi:hypothetical protein